MYVDEGENPKSHRLVPVFGVKTRSVRVQMDDLDVLQHLKVGDDETPGMVIHRILGMYNEFQFREEYATKLEREGGERLIKIAALEKELDERTSEIYDLREAAKYRGENDPESEKLRSIVTRQTAKIRSLRRDIDELISLRTVLRKSLQLAHAAGDKLTEPYKKQIEVLNGVIARMREDPNDKLVLRYPKPNEPVSIVISTMRGTFDDAIAGMRERHQKIIVADEVVTIEEIKDDESLSTMIHTGRDTAINIIIGGGEAK